MGTIALDDTEICALDFFIRGITISAFQTFAAASNAEAFPGLARIDHLIIPRPALWTTHSVGALSITQQLVASMRNDNRKNPHPTKGNFVPDQDRPRARLPASTEGGLTLQQLWARQFFSLASPFFLRTRNQLFCFPISYNRIRLVLFYK